MKIAIGCDHAGINLKPELIKYLEKNGYQYTDFGCYDSTSVDYNDYAEKVAEEVSKNNYDKGIIICGTGIGVSIVANKVKGIRCAHCHDVFSAKMTRLHNDANVLTFGERVIGKGLMLEIVEAFLTTPFSHEEKHQRRIDKITALEDKNFK